MGLFSRITGHIKDLYNMAIAVGNVIVLLDQYDATNDNSILPIAAWICKKGVQDIMLTGNMSPMYTINIVVDHRVHKMTVHEAYLKSIGRLSMIAGELAEQDKEYILDIINGEKPFSEVDSYLTEEKKHQLLKRYITFK